MTFRCTPEKVGEMDGGFFRLDGRIDIVEVKRPVCGCDRLNLSGDNYECCDCGMVFRPEYKEGKAC